MFSVDQLLHNLRLEQLDDCLFPGEPLPLPLPKVYGGQVMTLAMSASAQTMDAGRVVHSVHDYFLRPGEALCTVDLHDRQGVYADAVCVPIA